MLIDTEGSFDKTDDFNNAVPTVLNCYVCKTYINEGQKYLPEGRKAFKLKNLTAFSGILRNFPQRKNAMGIFAETSAYNIMNRRC